ncbi:thiazole tautomerase (transcriptional regulator TenI) [Halobacillus dabanensis]|uniref:Thiazole tautomerase (Transcriptional regulator TenI) n=1 Tax=Halobacillus dabanensis TaxID=240302 RepID=A0A1I3WB32_HALDA|nr:thiamine phosphate synthase [Halobacillus dabanensis]SFK03661.1 thiazole tautomerase (transcriptional regulator TenI) [Halobacillus dabanensis]
MRPSIHLISTGDQTFAELTDMVTSVQREVDYLHIREKHRSAAEIFDGLQQLTNAGFPMERIIINDRADVASVAQSFGVQLTHHSLPVSQVKHTFPALNVGKSVHSLEGAIVADQEGADFLIYGNLYPTSSKPGKAGKGLDSLREIVRHVGCPVVGIGGITPERACDVIRTGARGVAVMSGVLKKGDPVKAAQAYRAEIDEGGCYE